MRFLVILFACILAWVLAAPSNIDQEDAFRLLNNYLLKYGPDENYYYVLRDDHGSAKRGLGPRPLRFGK